MNKYAPKNIDKREAQQLYDSGLSIRKLAKHYNVCQQTIVRLNLNCRTVTEANKLAAPNKIYTKEGIAKLSQKAKEQGLGGYKPHPNKGKYYKDIWFDSNWEVLVAISLDENKIEWVRPRIGFIWKDNRKYYPDFYLPAYDIYLDPKNTYLQKKDKEKIDMACLINNIKVLVLSENELTWGKIQALIV